MAAWLTGMSIILSMHISRPTALATPQTYGDVGDYENRHGR